MKEAKNGKNFFNYSIKSYVPYITHQKQYTGFNLFNQLTFVGLVFLGECL